MSCTERAHIILAFALAANEGNIAAEDLEFAASEGARQDAQKSVEAARNYCTSLLARILDHCGQHGCGNNVYPACPRSRLSGEAIPSRLESSGAPGAPSADLT